MAEAPPRAARAGLGARFFVAGVLLAIAALGAGLLFTAAQRQQAVQKAQPLENVQWAVFQLSVEYWRLSANLNHALDHRYDEQSLETAEERYEIFMSRVPILARGEIGQVLARLPAIAVRVARIEEAAVGIDTAAEAESDRHRRLERIAARLPDMVDDVIRIGPQTVEALARQRDAGTTAIERTQAQLGWLVGLMLASSFGFLILVWIQVRGLERSRMRLTIMSRSAEMHRAQAEAASAAKSRFLAHMSHELRTPLNGLIGLLDLMAEHDLPQTPSSHLSMARSSADHLLRVIGDILDMSKLEAGRVTLEHIPFRLDRLVQDVAEGIAPLAGAKGLSFSLQVEGGAAAVPVLGDPTRVRQVLSNLLSNALKFTERGGIRLSLSAERAEQEVAFALAVADDGQGIPRETLAQLFQPFEQADSSIARRHGGTGLGLAISRELVTLMGGRISCASAPGVGTTMEVRLRLALAPPGALAEPAAPAAGAAAGLPALRVLLAEDDPTSRLVATRILQGLGLSVSVAENGVLAVEVAEAEPFDLILMDMQMPCMDGLAATERIRAGHGPNRTSPIVALTANVFSDDIERCLQAGMTAHLAKPLRKAALAAMVERVLPDHGSAAAEAPAPAGGGPAAASRVAARRAH